MANADLNLPADAASGDDIKSCCAAVYEHAAARILLGDTLHPGGLALTEALGKSLGLHEGSHLLDIASGTGASAIFLAQRFGCRVTGVDYSAQSVDEANGRAANEGLADRVGFRQADAERLPFPDQRFDAVLCECAFCLFPDKTQAASEFARVLRPGGRLALSDVARDGPLPPSLDQLMAWVACIADARPVEDYEGYLRAAGFDIRDATRHDEALGALVDNARLKLLGADVLIGLGKLDMAPGDLAAAKEIAAEARQAITHGQLGYAAIAAAKPA